MDNVNYKVLLFAILILFCTMAVAKPRWEWGIGKMNVGITPNGLYYQEHAKDSVPYRFDLKTETYSLGVSDYIDTPTWVPATRLRLEYLNSGTVRSVAKGTSDENYDVPNRTCVRQPCALETFATWSVETRHRGVVLSLAPEWSALGGKLFLEGGVYFGKPKVTVTIDRPTGESETYRYKGGWNVGSVVGAGYERGNTQYYARFIHMDAVNRNKGVFEEDLPPNHNTKAFHFGVKVWFKPAGLGF